MLKFTWFKRTLTKATPLQRELATKTFNSLWEQYHLGTEHIRQLWQHGMISRTEYQKRTSYYFKSFRQELKARMEVIVLL